MYFSIERERDGDKYARGRAEKKDENEAQERQIKPGERDGQTPRRRRASG